MNNYINLKEMFAEMVIKKNASLIPKYYHHDFLLFSNGKIMNFDDTLRFHEAIYQTSIQYQVDYDEDSVVVSEDKVAIRMYITTSKPNEELKELELILIVQYKEGKIYRAWELTYPDWSIDKKFKENLDRL